MDAAESLGLEKFAAENCGPYSLLPLVCTILIYSSRLCFMIQFDRRTGTQSFLFSSYPMRYTNRLLLLFTVVLLYKACQKTPTGQPKCRERSILSLR